MPSEQQAWEDMSQHSDGELDDQELRALEDDLLAFGAEEDDGGTAEASQVRYS